MNETDPLDNNLEMEMQILFTSSSKYAANLIQEANVRICNIARFVAR